MTPLNKATSDALSEKETCPETSVSSTTEYDEYLGLCEAMTEEKLKRLVRKLIFAYFLSSLYSIACPISTEQTSMTGNAKRFGAQADLGMSGQDWNTARSVFFVTYALGAVPANILLQRLGPRIWLPTMMLLVSITLICASLQKNFAGWTAFHVLLGAVEAGVFPGCSAVLTTWYSPHEVHTRMTIFYMGASSAGAFSGLLAFAIGQLDGTWGYRGWRWIYCLEGILSAVLSIGAFFVIYDKPSTVAFLTAEEKRFVVLRHKFSAGGESGVAEKEEFSWGAAKQVFKSMHVYACVLMEFTLCVVVYGVSFVLPTIIANLGYSAANAKAMTAPPYIFAALVTVFSGWAADRYQQRMLSVLLPNFLAMIGFIIIIISVRYKQLPGVTLFGVFFASGGLYPISPAVTAWTALNLAGTMKRSVGIGAMIAFSQLGGIVGSDIYLAHESPRYPVGFGISISMLGLFGILWPVCYYLILRRINAKRAAMPHEDVKEKYSDEQLADMGDESPLFRYAT